MGRAWSTQDEARLHVRSERLYSIENLKNPIGNSQIEIVQLGRGRFCGEILHGQIKDIAFSRGHFSLPVRATGVFSRDKLVIGALLNCSGASRSLADPVVSGDVLVHPPGSEHDRLYEGAAHFAGLMCAPAAAKTGSRRYINADRVRFPYGPRGSRVRVESSSRVRP